MKTRDPVGGWQGSLLPARFVCLVWRRRRRSFRTMPASQGPGSSVMRKNRRMQNTKAGLRSER